MLTTAPAIDDIRKQVRDLCPDFQVRSLDLVGSAATGHYIPGKSDLDFVVQFQPGLPTGHADRYFGLLFALEDRFGQSIDLLDEKALRNPYLIKSLQKMRINVYPA